MYCRTRVGRNNTIGRGLSLVVIDPPPRFYELILRVFPFLSLSLLPPRSRHRPLCLFPPGKTADSRYCVSVENFHDRSAVVCVRERASDADNTGYVPLTIAVSREFHPGECRRRERKSKQ